MDLFWAAPPVIRTIVAATVFTSVLVYSQAAQAYYFIFWPPLLYKTFPPQLWRLVTSFWLTGPKLRIIFDPYFLWTYGSALELTSPRFLRKGDFFWYVVFVELFILILDGGFLGGYAFISNLILAFAYTYSQDNANRQVSFFFITFSARWLPLAMLAMTFVMDGPEPCTHQVTGLLAAHTHGYLTRLWPHYGGGTNFLQTPGFVRKLFRDEGPTQPTQRGYGTAFPGPQSREEPAQGRSTGQSAGETTAVPNWRGQGRRLGD